MPAIQPLFVVDIETPSGESPKPTFDALKARMRLTGINSDTDLHKELVLSTEEAGLEFWRKLGRQRVASLQALPSISTCTTEDHWSRRLVEVTEVLLVRFYLLEKAQTIWRGADGSARDEWNDAGFIRGRSWEEVDIERAQLRTRIDRHLAVLGGSTESASAHIATIEPDEDDVVTVNEILI